MDAKLNVNQQCALFGKKADGYAPFTSAASISFCLAPRVAKAFPRVIPTLPLK